MAKLLPSHLKCHFTQLPNAVTYYLPSPRLAPPHPTLQTLSPIFSWFKHPALILAHICDAWISGSWVTSWPSFSSDLSASLTDVDGIFWHLPHFSVAVHCLEIPEPSLNIFSIFWDTGSAVGQCKHFRSTRKLLTESDALVGKPPYVLLKDTWKVYKVLKLLLSSS